MRIKKAVITAAGERQRRLPLQTLVDRSGESRTVLTILLREILSAQIEEVCIVVRPGDQAAYLDAAPEQSGMIRFVEQPEALGYGDSLWRTRSFVGEEPFLHLVGDHLYVSTGGGCALDLIRLAEQESCCVSAVRATHERALSSFGAIGGQPVPRRPNAFRVESVIEKPTPTVAEQRLIVPGMRAGHYLAFFGMHVLTPSLMETLDELRGAPRERPLTLSDALAVLARKEKYLALQVTAERFDLGAPYGLLASQLALGLSGVDRDQVMSLIISLLANEQLRPQGASAP